MRSIRVATCLLALFAGIAQAHNKVVVIPMAGDDLKPLKNIITVAKKNGDFTDPVAAVASITDEAQDNPYLVVIAPGVYTLSQTLRMQEWISISGSGVKTTTLQGAISSLQLSDASLVTCADNTHLSDLTIKNTGVTGAGSVGLYCESASPEIHQVDIEVTGGTVVAGMLNAMFATPKMRGMRINAEGAAYSSDVRGVINNESNPNMIDIVAVAIFGNTAIGISNEDSSPSMTNVTAISEFATHIGMGISNAVTSIPMMNNVNAIASESARTYGIYSDNSTPEMTNVTAYGGPSSIESHGIYNDESAAVMNNVVVTVTSNSNGSNIASGVTNVNSSPTMNHMTISVSGAHQNTGVKNDNNSSPRIKGSSIEAGMIIGSAATRVSDTLIEGGVTDIAGTQCRNTYKPDLTNEAC